MSRAARVTAGLGLGLLLLLAALVLSLLLLLNSEAGSRLLVNQTLRVLDSREGMALSYGALRGRLLDAVVLEDLRVELEAETGRQEIALRSLELRWSPGALLGRTLKVEALVLNGLDLRVESYDVESPPTDIGAVLDSLFGLPVRVEVDELSATELDLDLNGTALQVALLEAAASLDAERLSLRALRLDSDLLQAEGEASLASDLGLEGQLAWRLPEQTPAVAGELRLGGDLRRVLLEHSLLSPASLLTEGEVAPGLLEQADPSFDLRHRLEGVDPQLPGMEAITALSAALTTRGSPARVEISGRVDATPRDFAPVGLDLGLVYAEGALNVEQLRLAGEQVELGASGNVVFSPLALRATWTLERFDSADSLPLLLENLSGAGAVELATEGAGLSGAVGLERLAGSINGYPLQAAGEARLEEGALADFGLDLRAEDNALNLSGALAPELGVSWELDAPALAVLLPELRGRLAGAGTVSGSIELPVVAGSLSGSGLSYPLEGGRAALAELSLDLQPLEQGNRFDLLLSDLALPLGAQELRVGALSLALTGLPESHTLVLAADSNQGSVELRANGGWDSELWSGSLDTAALNTDYGDWRLREALALQAGAAQATVAPHCWDYASLALCAEADWQAEAGYSAALSLSTLPLAWLNQAATLELLGDAELSARWNSRPEGLAELLQSAGGSLPAQVFVDGELGLSASASGAPGAAPTVELLLEPEALRLGLLVEQDSESQSLRPATEVFHLREPELTLSGANGNWSAAASFAILHQHNEETPLALGRLDARAGLSAADELDGSLLLDFDSLSWLATLVPQVSEPRGEVRAALRLQGTRTAPALLGELRLRDGGGAVPEYGLDLSELDLALRSESAELYRLEGSLRSGEGSLRLDSTLRSPFGEQPSLDLSLRGEDFELADRPDLRVVADPDLQLALSRERVDIRGSVAVPHFLLDLDDSDLLANRGGVEVSRDVIVVNAPAGAGQEADGGAASQALRSVPVVGNIRIALGEDVRFQGMGLALQLGGQLNVEMEANRPVLAYGEVDILEGSYEAYGQELNAEGKLIFLGNPANPALDMRAFREVGSATVGVQLSGTVSSIQGQLYSTPTLPESEILAMLVTGKSFQNVGEQDSNSMLTAIANFGIERGQGITNTVRSKLGLDTLELAGAGEDLNESSLGLGKYITPDLFLRYDIGLFDRQSSLSINYVLTERLRLEVKTGVSQSVDLTYTVEQ